VPGGHTDGVARESLAGGENEIELGRGQEAGNA